MTKNNVNFLSVSNKKENYLDHIPEMQRQDFELLKRKDSEYDKSWIKSYDLGLTQGVFQLIYEKFQRLQKQCKKHNFDLFETVKNDRREEGVIDDIRDLRGYLTLIEAELINRDIINYRKYANPLSAKITSTDISEFSRTEHLMQDSNIKDEEQINTEYVNDRSGMKHPFGYDEESDN